MELNVLKFKKRFAVVNVKSNGIRGRYKVNIVNNHGLFGVEYPPELSRVLNRFPRESKELLSKLQQKSRRIV
jgi:hypothetical protein